MRKIKEVLRLKHQLGLANRAIARSCSLSHSTVAEYLRRAEEAGLTWPLPEGEDHARLEARLFPPEQAAAHERALPDFAALHQELRRDKHVTLQLLWLEYKQDHPSGYQYSRFCELYRRWAGKLDPVMRREHRAGEKMFVDWAGRQVAVTDPKTGEVEQASIFVAVLGASNYTFAEATLGQDLGCWIGSHCRALQFFGGCPAAVVPDNCRTAVSKPCRYEPELNPSYADWAQHYGLAVLPARVRRPRDKAKVENAVLVVERWILAALRKRTFFSLAELNQAVAELLERLNRRPFRKLPGSRASWFEELERPALRPLPAQAYLLAEWKKAKVNIDCHIELKGHCYSAPCRLVGEQVELRYTAATVEVFHRGQRVASHRRSWKPHGATTLAEHLPPAHRRFLEWTPSRLIHWAGQTGPWTARLVEQWLGARQYPEQAFRSCLGLLRLGKTFGGERLEAACRRAVQFRITSCKGVCSILQSGMDRHPDDPLPSTGGGALTHENVRGAGYFQDLPQQEAAPC